jgi:hypothetical protein
MSKAELEALENEVNAELLARAKAEHPDIYPITDGVIDEAQFLASSPKMLWILKEPWEIGGFGDWSLTKKLIPDLIVQNQICGHKSYGPMAYVTFSVFNNFLVYADIRAAGNTSKIGESLKNISYINVSKLPGKSQSIPSQIAAHYRTNRSILLKQIMVINPDVVIGGSTLTLFLDDLGLTNEEFKPTGSLKFCVKAQRLYIDAYHPARRDHQVKTSDYVDEIVSVIKNHCPALHLSALSP